MKSLSREEVRAIDRCAIETLGVPGAVLMENAGRRAADAIEKFLSGAGGKSVAVVAGAGNNGGDGFVIARHLAMRGAKVVTFLTSPAEKITGEAAVNLNILRKLKHKIIEIAGEEIKSLSSRLSESDLILDAVGGTGVCGPLRENLTAIVEQINAASRPVVAVDIPTGLDCDTGEAAGPCVRAAMTVTFIARKKGFDAPGAAGYTGEVVVADIGIPAELLADA